MNGRHLLTKVLDRMPIHVVVLLEDGPNAITGSIGCDTGRQERIIYPQNVRGKQSGFEGRESLSRGVVEVERPILRLKA
jgi:hypothetical protein